MKDQLDWIYGNVVEDMVDVFVAHTVGNRMDKDGLDQLSHLFGTVPEDERARVYTEFVSELIESNYQFDMSQFREYKA